MRLDNAFEVAAPAAHVWDTLNDVPTVVPCLPGAELIEAISEDAWKTMVHVKLGPIALQFETTVTRELTDASSRRVVLDATAREVRGRGGAHARIESTLTDQNGTTRVELNTNLTLRGAVAQYGRGVVPSVAAQLTRQFAENLAAVMTTPADLADSQSEKPAPVSAPALVFRALWHALRTAVRRVRSRWLIG